MLRPTEEGIATVASYLTKSLVVRDSPPTLKPGWLFAIEVSEHVAAVPRKND